MYQLQKDTSQVVGGTIMNLMEKVSSVTVGLFLFCLAAAIFHTLTAILCTFVSDKYCGENENR